MPARRCQVSLTDIQGVTHAIEVTAETLFEAVAVALRDLRASGLAPVTPGPATPITVRVLASADAEHTVTLRQVEAWMNGTARSPKEKLTKERLREMLAG